MIYKIYKFIFILLVPLLIVLYLRSRLLQTVNTGYVYVNIIGIDTYKINSPENSLIYYDNTEKDGLVISFHEETFFHGKREGSFTVNGRKYTYEVIRSGILLHDLYVHNPNGITGSYPDMNLSNIWFRDFLEWDLQQNGISDHKQRINSNKTEPEAVFLKTGVISAVMAYIRRSRLLNLMKVLTVFQILGYIMFLCGWFFSQPLERKAGKRAVSLMRWGGLLLMGTVILPFLPYESWLHAVGMEIQKVMKGSRYIL